MPTRTRTSNPRPARDRWVPPLPHPSWRGEAAAGQPARPLPAAEFWRRLGL